MSEESRLTTMPRFTRVFYDTYAALPVAGLRIGELAFATDRLLLYRWSGVAWVILTQNTIWNYLDTVAVAAAASAEITFAAHDMIKIMFALNCSQITDLRGTLNGVANNYRSRWINNSAHAFDAGYINYFDILGSNAAITRWIGELTISGRHVSTSKGFSFMGTPHMQFELMLLNGVQVGDANDLTSVQLFPAAGTITGDVSAYGFNF